MKNLRQVKDLIKNMAKEKAINAQILLRNYMLERLLERISLSDFKDKFILKGGMLVAAMVGVDMRSTIDMDTTIKDYPFSMDSVKIALESILLVEVEDGVEIKLIRIDQIREEDEYKGYRASLEAQMENARIPLKLDITTGDKITPKEITYEFNLLLENRTIEILSYNLETVLAEKIETLIARGTANTRMRDFYDIYILSKIYGSRIDSKILFEALSSTSERRESKELLAEGDLIIKEVFEADNLAKHWNRYQKNYTYASEISWDEIKEEVKKLCQGLVF